MLDDAFFASYYRSIKDLKNDNTIEPPGIPI